MRPHRAASPVVVTLITLAALTLLFLFFRQVYVYERGIQTGHDAGPPQFTLSGKAAAPTVAGAASVATDDDPSIGLKDAKLTVVEFLDFQCPFCQAAFDAFRAMTVKYGDRARFIVRDFPVAELHPEAVIAAEAAGCAQAQGKFWPMHDRLFAAKGQLTRSDLDRLALQSGLDQAAYASCMDGHDRLAEIKADIADGLAAGVRGTPTFFFNGQKVEGVIPQDVFDRTIGGYLNR